MTGVQRHKVSSSNEEFIVNFEEQTYLLVELSYLSHKKVISIPPWGINSLKRTSNNKWSCLHGCYSSLLLKRFLSTRLEQLPCINWNPMRVLSDASAMAFSLITEKIAFIICQLSRILWQVELYYQRKSSKLINTHLHARIFMPKWQCPNRPVGFQSRASRESFLLRSFSKEIVFSRPKMLSSLVKELTRFVWRGDRWSLFE